VGFVLLSQVRNNTMNTKRTTLRPRFARETRYELAPTPVATFRATREAEFERFKETLLRHALRSAEDAELYASLRRAANEAAALAWTTPFPLLFLPALFEEKTLAARHHTARQRSVRVRSRELFGAAVK